VELGQLRFFVTVAHERHFGRAADALFVGQPAISQGIRRLERELRLQLFDRTGRGVRLTVAGEAFLPHARAVLAAVDTAAAAANEIAGTASSALVIGTCTGLGDHIHRVLKAFADVRSDVAIELVPVPASERYELVASRRLDAAFTHDIEDRADVEAIPLWRDALVVALPATHLLAQRGSVSLSELADLPLRIVERPRNPLVRNLVLDACRVAGFEPRLARTAASLEDNLAEIGTGPPTWTVLYASHARRINPRAEVFLPLTDPVLEVQTHLLLRAGERDVRIGTFLRACDG
jgi:DNA-binding transcriptional LysR family regulator